MGMGVSQLDLTNLILKDEILLATCLFYDELERVHMLWIFNV